MTQLEEYQAIRIEALEQEVLRLNEALETAKMAVNRIKVSEPKFMTRPYGPNFDKRISEIEVVQREMPTIIPNEN